MSVNTCLPCMSKVCRWKFFPLLAWFFLTIHLSLLISEVSYKPPHLTYNFFFLLQLLHSQLLYVKPFLIDMSALTLIWQAQQQQHQQQQQCKCHTGMSLEADSSQGPHSLWCICCHPCSCGCWHWFSSLCWSAAACSVHSLFSDKRHPCAVWCECFVHTATHHTESGENSLIIIHKCNSDSESRCVDVCWLCQLSDTQYDALFEMLLYIRTFQWMLW